MSKAVNLVRNNCSLIETILSWRTKAVLMRMVLVKKTIFISFNTYFSSSIFPFQRHTHGSITSCQWRCFSGQWSIGIWETKWRQGSEIQYYFLDTFSMPWVKCQGKREGEILICLGCFSLLLLDSLLLLMSQKPTALPQFLTLPEAPKGGPTKHQLGLQTKSVLSQLTQSPMVHFLNYMIEMTENITLLSKGLWEGMAQAGYESHVTMESVSTFS